MTGQCFQATPDTTLKNAPFIPSPATVLRITGPFLHPTLQAKMKVYAVCRSGAACFSKQSIRSPLVDASSSSVASLA
ncbi:hypothetical protein PoB_003649500 [Plakobranchus ocellatus]|uniref:Uncharacterized protein n=1 Tax=Plakobranchus ocellatus TaxID=259542 RepID=A0AAV4ASX7_9GAST|nr:hypothetical protein PoB_003649500 [Plakobranchus ocellatus]